MEATHVSGGSRRVEEKAPLDPHRVVYAGIGVAPYGFRTRGLEAKRPSPTVRVLTVPIPSQDMRGLESPKPMESDSITRIKSDP